MRLSSVSGTIVGLPPHVGASDSTSANFCTILPGQRGAGAVEGECGRGFSASYLLR
jgi:hypothetical protein